MSLRKKCLYSELSCSVFSQMRENTDQNNSVYGHFSHSVNRVNFLNANLYSLGKMKPNCVRLWKNEGKLNQDGKEKCVLISYNVYFCEQIPVCLKLFIWLK